MIITDQDIQEVLRYVLNHGIIKIDNNTPNRTIGAIHTAHESKLLIPITRSTFGISDKGKNYLRLIDRSAPKQKRIPAIQKLVSAIKERTLTEWGLLISLIGLIVTLWMLYIKT